MSSRNRATGWIGLWLALGWAGCEPAPDRTWLAEAEAALESAERAIEAEQYNRAVEALDRALERGGLSPDAFGEALIQRAICHVRLGNVRQAAADLRAAERGAPPDAVHAARSFLLQRQGRRRDAEAAWRAARRFNPLVVPVRP